MSDENKPDLKLVEVKEHVPEQLTQEVEKEEPKAPSEFNQTERSGFMIEHEHPKKLMLLLKKMAKEKPNALARVVYNEILFPFQQVDLLSKEEKELSSYFSQILRDKREILFWSEKEKQRRENENKK